MGTLNDEDTQQPVVEHVDASHPVSHDHSMFVAETTGGDMESEAIDLSGESATDVQAGDVLSDTPKEIVSVSTPATSIDDGPDSHHVVRSDVLEHEVVFLNERKRRPASSFRIDSSGKRARVIIDLT